ncbi:protein SOB FIVE-LIKE [Trifolium repens]|nr:protein SOB FIVE-LIKE [Trifolium repens]
MEQPHHMFLGGEEECQSSESGWTMYIGSPIKDGNFYDDDDDEVDFYQGINQITQGDAGIESDDDSMVSDASSGPSHYGVDVIQPLGNYEEGYGLRHFKQKVEDDEYDDDYYYFDHHKKGSKKKQNQIGEKKCEKKQKVQVQGGGKGHQGDGN